MNPCNYPFHQQLKAPIIGGLLDTIFLAEWMIMLATVLLTFIERPLSLDGGLQSVDYEAFFVDRDRGQAMFRVRSATQLGFIAPIRGLHLDRTLPRPTACKLDKL